MRDLFNPDNFDKIWRGDTRQYVVNIFAASTGVRMGEVRGLLREKVYDDYISIHHKWTDKYGLADPKVKSFRDIPVPSRTSECLHNLMKLSPYQNPGDFVFWGDLNRERPMSDTVIRRRLYYALNCIGITEEERNIRGLDFHSWRHVFNTMHRGRIPDYKLQRVTGHRTQQMTERYTNLSRADYRDVLQIQEQVQEGYFGS
jgi:integrase